jgi:hypothetical protein
MIRLSRTGAALAAGALTLGLVAGTAGTASAAPEDRAGRWLAKQLTDGLVHNDVYDFDDYGLTADTATALAAVGGHGRSVRQAERALARHVDSWTTGVDFGSSDVYAGSVAKATAFAQTVGADPRSFGGVDLVARLADRISAADGTVGRLQDKTDGTDYANTLGQAYAAAALTNAGSDRARDAVAFLLQQQCDAGFFRLYFADASAPDQTCDGAARADRAPDTDATAIALLNLQSIERPSKKVRQAATAAVRWLVGHQKRNGSFGGGTTTKASNANSTGLAAWVLSEAGRCRPAQRAAGWVAGLQKRSGAVAYDRDAFRAGVDADSLDQWRRATSQAAPGLATPGC